MPTALNRRWLLLIVALTMIISVVYFGSDQAGAASEESRRSTIKWRTCHENLAEEMGVVYECDHLDVPLDYDKPEGEQISLSLVRIPATAEPRLGSLFLNPGGPGGSGVEFALFFGPFAQFIWGPVANQYDIVGFDPRGIMRSSPLLCFDSLEEAESIFPPVPFPISRSEISFFKSADQTLNRQCAQNGTEVLNHMSTANVARDLDRLREAVGDDELNYVGLSYGSYLGQTYANLFPEKVGALVIDGILDPVAWANTQADVPFSTALRSDAGAQATWEEFSRQCDDAGPTYCALAPDSMARMEALLERLRDEPIVVTDPGSGATFEYLYSFGVIDLLIGLYNPPAYQEVAGFFAFLESQAATTAEVLEGERQRMQDAVGLSGGRRSYPNFVEGFPGVACEDTRNPRGHNAWWEAGLEATAQFGIFGEPWTWASSPCAVWSHRDRDVYQGPFDTSTNNPVLVIGNLYDPATRYEGALTANGLLEDSALVTVDEPGHTSLGLNACAGFTTGQYLANPADASWVDADIFCASGSNWFVQSGPMIQATGESTADFRASVLDEVAIRP